MRESRKKIDVRSSRNTSVQAGSSRVEFSEAGEDFTETPSTTTGRSAIRARR